MYSDSDCTRDFFSGIGERYDNGIVNVKICAHVLLVGEALVATMTDIIRRWKITRKQVI